MQTVLMQHVWWKSLNPVNTLFFVIEVWMKVPRQVHGDGAERWRNQEEETIRAESRHRLRLLRCLTQVNERGRSTHVWPVHTRLQLSQVVIILRDSSLKLQLSIRHFTASTAELHRISASGLWPGGLSSPRMSSSCHLKKGFHSRISGHKGQALSVPALLLEPWNSHAQGADTVEGKRGNTINLKSLDEITAERRKTLMSRDEVRNVGNDPKFRVIRRKSWRVKDENRMKESAFLLQQQTSAGTQSAQPALRFVLIYSADLK